MAAGGVKVIVTGGRGFLGRYLCQTLLRRRRLNGRPLDTLAILDAGADTHVGCGASVGWV
jgi:nucleoside-diphosphate-sugar epimerase